MKIYFCIQDFSENDVINETEELPQNKILRETNANVLSNEIKKKKHKKKKKPKNTSVKCAEVEEIQTFLLQTIENKDASALKIFLLMEDLNKPFSKENLEISLNEAIDEKNNTVLHLASSSCLHDHVQ